MVLVVPGIDVHVLEACDVVIKQQEYSGVQMAFSGECGSIGIAIVSQFMARIFAIECLVLLGFELRESSSGDEGWEAL